MLTFTHEVFKGSSFTYYVFGTESEKTQIYSFTEDEFSNEKKLKKLLSLLKSIDTAPLTYHHPEKFKPLKGEEGVWEMKIFQIRIACLWDPKPQKLVGLYGFTKKQDNWPNGDLIQMRNQKTLYMQKKQKSLEGGQHARIR